MNFILQRNKKIDTDGPIPGTIGTITGAPFTIDTLERNDKALAAGVYDIDVQPMYSHGGVLRVHIIAPPRAGIFAHSITEQPNEESELEGCVGIGDQKPAEDQLGGGVVDHVADKFAALVTANPGSKLTVIDILEAA